MKSIFQKIFHGINKWYLWIKTTKSIPMVEIRVKNKRFGSKYGGYYIATPFINSNTLLYSFGVGKDISFEKELEEEYHCKFHLFDPTPESITWLRNQNLPSNFSCYEYGISGSDGFITVYPPKEKNRISHSIINHKWASDSSLKFPVKSLTSIMTELSHSQIDVLKMDIEGSEYAIIDALYKCDIRPGQIIIEFHHHFPEIGLDPTKEALLLLRKMGYKLFAFSLRLEEFSFIHESEFTKE